MSCSAKSASGARARPHGFSKSRRHDAVVDGFQRLYGDSTRAMPSWPAWVEGVKALAPHARAAFSGEENLHDHADAMARLKAVYDSLTREAAERRLTWRR